VVTAVDYQEFIEGKIVTAKPAGFVVEPGEVNPVLKPFQREIVRWAVQGGRRALFESFGLGKTIQQLETARLIVARKGGRGLIVCPLGVRQEFARDAVEVLGWPVPPRFIRRIEEADQWQEPLPAGVRDHTAGTGAIYLTNYETVRDGKLDPRGFTVLSLDEAGVLRGFGGTKTFREMMRLYEGTAGYRFVATATPDPNEFIELLAYAAFLDVMDVGQAKTRFFKRDSTKADKLTLHPHKAEEFWLWVSSWAVFLSKPSDLGPEHSDDGYVLPPMTVHWHEVPSDHSQAGARDDGQGRLFLSASHGVSEAAGEKRRSLLARIAKLLELRELDPQAHRIIWHDLESERRAIESAVPGVVSVFGAQEMEEREAAIIGFSTGSVAELASKPVMLGQGCNFQRHCAWAIFLGIGFKFNDFIQSVHRVHRFLQQRPVRIDLIYTEAEQPIRTILEEKWRRHEEQTARMGELIRQYGLANVGKLDAMRRSIGVQRLEAQGQTYRLIRNDCVEECRAFAPDSVDMIITSIPFATQYEYTPSYNDFGHTDDNAHFWRQMDYLTPELYRVLRPGRVCCIHVKDRIVPSGMSGLGFQTVGPLHAEAIAHYVRHGFGYLGMKTVVTDVVRENNQTYRLGWTEQCKDGSRMGCGMPEYILLFRKPPTDRSNGYADVPVVKSKEAYRLSRWQVDANGFQRSGGDRPLTPDELRGLPHDEIYRRWRERNAAAVYDYREHVATGQAMEDARRLPVTFNLLPPHSWHPDVWTDVARMRTLNMEQERRGQEMHLCPLQFDIAQRLIVQHSMEGETILDPFAGLATVPYMAIKLGRVGLGIELNAEYWQCGARYCQEMEAQVKTPTLFDLLATEAGESQGPGADTALAAEG
jgi:hypothetical protein